MRAAALQIPMSENNEDRRCSKRGVEDPCSLVEQAVPALPWARCGADLFVQSCCFGVFFFCHVEEQGVKEQFGRYQ